jgi:hypothetical protein
MNSTQEADLKNRLLSQAVALVEKATGGTSEPLVVEALLAACILLEDSSKSNSPIVALERDVHTDTGTYHLFIRRLSTSVPAGKFQILITRELASGLIYPH